MIEELLTPEIRKLFTGLNFDLLYGLPLQTRETFENTLTEVEKFSPDRITLLKYAHVPDVRKHMKSIKTEDLPPNDDLPHMFLDSVRTILSQGYEWVGIDHFAKKTDDLGLAVKEKTVWRNFNGFTPGRTNHLIGVGPTSTGAFGSYYVQNLFELKDYFNSIEEGVFPVFRGYKMTFDDIVRREIIFSFLCIQEVNIREIGVKYNIDFLDMFKSEVTQLENEYVKEGLVVREGDTIKINSYGRFLTRNICRIFDKFTRDKIYLIPGPVLGGSKSVM
jgi:oxygen-independent coproporphyrinogen-3 oxidase